MTHLHWLNILTFLEEGQTEGSKNMKTCLINLKLLN